VPSHFYCRWSVFYHLFFQPLFFVEQQFSSRLLFEVVVIFNGRRSVLFIFLFFRQLNIDERPAVGLNQTWPVGRPVSVCPSVCPSITSRNWLNVASRKQCRTIARNSSFLGTKISAKFQWIIFNGGAKYRWSGLKYGDFRPISCYISGTV